MKIIVAIFVLMLPQISWAFSNYGHELICQVAYELTEPATQKFIDEVVKRGDKVKVHNFADYRQQKNLSEFAKGCTWPDVVRKSTHRETDQYHYMNVPKGMAFNHRRDCGAFDCVTQAIQRYSIDLSDKNVNATNRKEALFFLGHFIADLHQPLHVGYTEDKGGNMIKLFATQNDEKLTSLHWLWDKHVPEYAGLYSLSAKQALLSAINDDAVEAWQTTNPVAWAKESHQIAKQYVYVWPNGTDIQPEQVVNKTYYQRVTPIIKQRFEQAAVRLALMLDLAAKGRLTVEHFE